MNIGRLDLNLLLVLDGLQKERNLSAVARRLGISQPAASASLARLRSFFGDELFVRTGRGMRPTPFAESIAVPVAQAVEIINGDILRRPHFNPEQSERVFTITTTDIGIPIFVPPLLRALRQQAPHARLQCIAVPLTELEEALADGAVDLAIGYFPTLPGPNVHVGPLFDHPFACLVRAAHPIIRGEVTLAQFLEAEHLVVMQESSGQQIYERRVRELGISRKTPMQLPYFMIVPQMIASSDMITTVPLSLGAWYAHLGIQILKPPIEIPMIELRQFWHRRVHDDPAVRWLRSVVSDQLMGRDPSLALSPAYSDLVKPAVRD